MAGYHEAWSIVSEKGVVVCHEDGCLAAYADPASAYAALAIIRKANPTRKLEVKTNRLTLP